MTNLELFLVSVAVTPGAIHNTIDEVSSRAFGPSLISDWFDPRIANSTLAEALAADLVRLVGDVVTMTEQGLAVRSAALEDAA